MSYQSTNDSLYDDVDPEISSEHSLLHSDRQPERFERFDDNRSVTKSFTRRSVLLIALVCTVVCVIALSYRSNSTSVQPAAVPASVDSESLSVPVSAQSLSEHSHHGSSRHSRSHSTDELDNDDESRRHSHGSRRSSDDEESDRSSSHSRSHRGSSSRHSAHDLRSESADQDQDDTEDEPSSRGSRGASATPDATSVTDSTQSSKTEQESSPLTQTGDCEPPYPGYPFCESKVAELKSTWNKDADSLEYYRGQGVDGSTCSFLNFLNKNGFYCPEAADVRRAMIRGVNLGGWLVLEPWIKPSMFTQFAVEDNVHDQWGYCEKLGKAECKRQLEKHWDTFLTYKDLQTLAESGINHVRIPVGYWLFGDIQTDEPWVTGDLAYLERAVKWCSDVGIHVVLDLHCAPGSQNGFDNSGRMGEVHFADTEVASNGRITYPNINRALRVIDALAKHFSAQEYKNTVSGIELVNEAFISIPLEIVKDYYLQGYEIVKKYGDIAVVIGDSFRFGAWGDFMFPPHYRHVWIDTHIYQVFDHYRLSFTWDQHIEQTCKINRPEVAVAPLSTMVGEWSLATKDCARWLNGYNNGARYDGTFHMGNEPPQPLGSCKGENDVTDSTVFTPDYKQFLRKFAEAQMDAYESGSSAGWFFWNFKTEGAPQWDYLLGLKEGWMPKDHSKRQYSCDKLFPQDNSPK